jgi:hypothetical protein
MGCVSWKEEIEMFSEKEWKVLERHINQDPEKFKPEFKDWLSKRPLLWKHFVSYALRGAAANTPYGFSTLALIQIIEMDSIIKDDFGDLESIDYRFVPDLGRLLIAVHPKTLDLLWRGERYRDPMLAYAPLFVQKLESECAEFKGFFSPEQDAIFDDPEYMVFPELKGLPPAEPDESSETCH